MAGAVNVSIVTFVGLILNVSGVDGDAAFSLFGSLIDHVICFEFGIALHSERLGDSRSKRGFTVVNVTNGTNVYVGFGSFEFFLCHWIVPPLINAK